jgi:hypothetical protein
MDLLNFTQVLYEVGPYILSPGQTVAIGIIYYTGENLAAFLTLNAAVAINVVFSIQSTLLEVQGADLDVQPDSTTYWITVTNTDPQNEAELFVLALTCFF